MKASAVALLGLACVFSAARGALAQDRREVPEAAAQKQAESILREIYKDDYKKKTPEDRVALARKLLQRAGEKRKDPAARFVCLREARDLSAQGGDGDLAFRAIEEMDRSFVVEALEMKSAALATAGKAKPDPARMAELYLRLADEAAAADRHDMAAQAAGAAAPFAKRSKDAALAAKVEAKTKEVADLKALCEEGRKAEETLAGKADDPAANLAAGRYRAMVKGNWAEGLPCLAKGADAELKALAEGELGMPADAAGQGAVADGWWDRAEKEAGIVRENVRNHALEWYVRAVESGLEGFKREKAMKRVLEVRRARGGGWEDVSNPALWGLDGKSNAIELADEGRAKLDKFPLGEFDGVSVRMRFGQEKDAGGTLMLGNQEILFTINPGSGILVTSTPSASGLLVDQEQIAKRDEYVLMVLIKGGEYVVYVDGDPKFKWKTDAASITEISLLSLLGTVSYSDVKLRYRK